MIYVFIWKGNDKTKRSATYQRHLNLNGVDLRFLRLSDLSTKSHSFNYKEIFRECSLRPSHLENVHVTHSEKSNVFIFLPQIAYGNISMSQALVLSTSCS